MLLHFEVQNYKSFRQKMVFSLVPKSRTGLEYSILHRSIGKRDYSALCSSVIYGPNASGKTNLIGAMDTFKKILIRGHIRNESNVGAYDNNNYASSRLELIPFFKDEESSPVNFNIKFIENDICFEYQLSVNLGKFMQADAKRSILEELFIVNERTVFERNSQLKIDNLSSISKYLNGGEDALNSSYQKIALDGLNEEEIFLTNGFKTIYSKDLVATFMDWIENKFLVYYSAQSVRLVPDLPNLSEGQMAVNTVVNNASKEFGSNSDMIGYVNTKEKIIPYSALGNGQAIPAEVFESFGTIRFINEFPLILRALENGCTIVIDEFDASLHPVALMNIINIFHNDEINKNNAQLIFNTHNPIFLNNSLFRRDEIKFVETDETTHESTLYSLSDFKTAGQRGTRSTSDYMRNYFINQYGAIKNVDFSPYINEYLSKVQKVVKSE